VRISLSGIVLFYAAINLGFLSSYQSQFNQGMWIDAFFRNLNQQKLLEDQKLYQQKKPVETQSDSTLSKVIPVQSADTTAGIKNLTFPIVPPDTTSKGNAPLVNSVLPKDTIAAKDSSSVKKNIDLQIKLPVNTLKTFTDPKKNKNDKAKLNPALAKDTSRFKDTLALKKDTIKIDSMAIDSTARLKYMKYTRDDEVPNVQLNQQYQTDLIAKPSDAVAKRVITIDSTGDYVEIKDVVGTQDRKIILRMPLEDYINLQVGLNEANIWGNNFNSLYAFKSSKRELGELMKDITSFEIPLPSVGVFSIFGKPVIKLTIGGSVDIHGAWRNTSTQGVTTSALGNTQNEPSFQQQVQINVDGTIGDKLNIHADWNTERTFEYQNMLHIKYTGYEDEIIQSIEAGNVSMQASPLVGGSEALFGIKAQMKLGPLTLTTLASQKKGEMKDVAVNSGAQSAPFTIRAYSYATNNFFVDTIYANTGTYNTFYNYYGASVPSVNQDLKVVQIQVWKSKNTTTYDKSKERNVNAFITLAPLDKNTDRYSDASNRSDSITVVQGQIVSGRYVLLTEGTDYIMHYETGYLTLLTTVNDDDGIAVAYSDMGGTRHFGEFISAATASTSTNTDSSRMVLKLVKAPSLKPQFTQAWKLMLKNIYSVNATNIKQEGFDLQIKYEIPGQDPVSTYPEGGAQVQLLNAFGLDYYDSGGNRNSDNVFDWRPQITVLPAAGEIIFPRLQPFSKENVVLAGLDTSLAFQAVYDTSATYAAQDQIHDKWAISGKYSGDATSVYQLGFNVVENSVKVTLNGKALNIGSDYSVDYNTGQLQILNSNALIPGADLKITFEQNDLFTLASKTLLGARGVFDISSKTKLGFSILNLNEQTLNDKVRIGEEPLNNTMMGVDLSTSADLPFLTDALDKIISTKQMSSFTFAGEFAHMSPDPNTMKSTIADDGGQSIAYIDDFEGSKKIIPIGVGYTAWKGLSAPDNIEKLTGFKTSSYMDDPSKDYYNNLMRYKAKSWWYSITPSNVNVKDIWGSKKQVATSDQQVSVMDYVFQPDTPGTYNMNPKNMNVNESGTDLRKNWGGMMKVLSSTANDLQAANMQYIEFWMQADPKTPIPDSAKIYIDLGRISEDVIPDKTLNSEDKNNNGVIDAGEDIGIDQLNNDDERAYAAKMGYNSANKGDPNNDDFSLSGTGSQDPNVYFNVNGTEGNGILVDVGRIPDTEDLNLNGNIDLVNSYFRYAVPLDSIKADSLKLIQGGGNTNEGWHLIRIPLQNSIDSVGTPSLSDVEYIRVFTTGVNKRVHVRFAEFNLVGNQWQQVIPYDPVMSVSVVNFEDNPLYTSPPGLAREQDRTQTTSTVYKNEQAMDLIVKDLQPGDKREAVEYLARALDVFNYKAMKVFFHGDDTPGKNIASTTDETRTAEVYLRFGTDTSNFYEYRQPVRQGWNDVSIVFKNLTAIKEARGNAKVGVTDSVSVDGSKYRYYGIRGSPSLTSIKFLTVGIRNKTTNTTLNGEVWVNELRVIGADNKAGNAYTLATTVKLADLLTLNFNMSYQDAYFHSLSSQFGSRNDTRSWSVGANLDVLKLLPFNMPGSSLSLNYSHTENVLMPLYMPGTDISIDASVAAAKASSNNSDSSKNTTHQTAEQIISSAQTISTSDSWSLGTIALKIPTSFWLIRDTFNALSFSFNYNKTFARSPTVLASSTWLWNAGMNYAVNLSQDNYIMPVRLPVIGSILGFLTDYRDMKIYFSPQSFAFNFSAKRNRAYSTSRAQYTSDSTYTPSSSVFNHDFTTARGFNFAWKFTDGGFINLATDYSASFSASLADFETDKGGKNLLPEYMVWRKILSGSIFGKDYSFQQNLNFRTSPKLPSIWDIDKNFNISASYSVGYQWAHNFSAVDTSNGVNSDAGISAGFQNKSQVSLKVSLKALMDPLFGSGDENSSLANGMPGNNAKGNNPAGGNPPQGAPPQGNPPGGNPEGRQRTFGQDAGDKNPNDTTQNKLGQNLADANKIKNVVPDSTVKSDSLSFLKSFKKSPIKNTLLILRTVAKTLFFDYESININFSNSSTISKSALLSKGTGFSNFWGFTINKTEGPSKLFMLGLNQDIGDRAPGLSTITDVYSQSNNIDLQTSRPLWPGAKIDLTWKVGWSLNKSTPFTTYETGGLLERIGTITSTGTISRSFLSLPPVFVLSVFKSSMKQVHSLYDPKAADPAASLSHAFIEGFETLPLLSQASFLQNVSTYVPRPNWTISWDGLEKFFPFKSIAERVTLDHSYSSGYTEGWYLDPDGKKVTQTQQINYAFAPLIGLNMTFGKLWSGNLSGNIKYGTSSTYSLGMSTYNITQASTRDIGISATYAKSGFEIPLFGVSLKNDIEFTFSYTYSQSSTVLFDMTDYKDSGTPQDGQTRVTIEPRVKYTISSKVTLSVFYTRTTVAPEGASRVEPTTSNEAGVDVHIAIGG
jgi:cell surface protein SprA